jgi:hypothetical protein
MRRIGGLLLLAMMFIVGWFFGVASNERALSESPVYELGPFLRAEAAARFQSFLRGESPKRVSLPIAEGCNIDVALAGSIGENVCGFTRTPRPMRRFWIGGNGFSVHRFDEDHLFILIKGWYLTELESDPAVRPATGKDGSHGDQLHNK